MGGGGGACMRNEPQLWALTQCIAVVANRVLMRRARHAYIGVVPRPHSKTIHLLLVLERCKGPHFEGFRGERIGRAFSPTAGRMCRWYPRGHRAQGRSMILSLRGRRSVNPTMTIMEERFPMTKAQLLTLMLIQNSQEALPSDQIPSMKHSIAHRANSRQHSELVSSRPGGIR